MYKLLSGAKSVKQYRGDENLPEAKNGMKNCGCKHPKTKYKYQFGSEDLKIKDEERSPLSKRSELLSKISTGEIDLRTGEKPKGFQTPSSDVLTKTKKYIPYSQMSDEDKVAYKKGIASGKNFEVGGRKYAAVVKKQNNILTEKKPSISVPQQKLPVKTTNVSKVAPKEEKWTDNQWKNFIRERNKEIADASAQKPVPVIPKAKPKLEQKPKPVLPLKVGNMPGYKPSKPIYEFDQVVNTPKTEVKKTETKGVFLDPRSKGVLMSQQGKPLPAPKNLRKTVKELTGLKNTPPQVSKPEPMDLRGPVSYALNKKRELDSKSLGEMKKIVSESNSLSSKTSKFFSNHGENKKDRIINNNLNPNNEPLLIDKILPDGDVKQAILNNPVSSWPSLASSAIRRKWAKSTPENERTTTIKVPDIDSSKIKFSEEKSKVIQRPDVYITGDTLKDRGLDRRYHLPEIIDLDSPNITYGTRNRGDYNEIETEGAPITSAYPFTSSKQYFANSKDNSNVDYIGVNSKGKVKIGKKNDFQDDDYQISKTLVQNVESFEGLKQAIGNKNFKSPEVNMITDSGVKMKTNLNFLVPKGNKQKAENAFDEVSGGRYIFETPDRNKKILVSGSLKTIKETFDKMKKDNPYVRIISLDNGSYAKGIRTFDQKLTAEDLKTYDAQNPEGGGNIVYIKSRVKKYKYGTGALTIPEGSAIVTANGGKNMQALKAYKKGNYKLLNKIIDDMPEDRVDRAKNGIKNTYKKYKFKPGTKNVNAEDEDDAWIKKILNYEAKQGGGKGNPLLNWGYNNRININNNNTPNDPNDDYPVDANSNQKVTIDDAVKYFKQDYASKFKDYPLKVRKRLADYSYNSGRSPEDLLLFADGKIDLDKINSKSTFTKEWNDNKTDILRKLDSPEFIKKLDAARTDVAKTTGEYQDPTYPNDPTKKKRYSLENPNPAYAATWQGRIANMQDENETPVANPNVPAVPVGNTGVQNSSVNNNANPNVAQNQNSSTNNGTAVTAANTQPVGAGQWTDTYDKLEKMLKHEKNKNLRAELFKRYKAANPSANITEDQYVDNLLTAQKQNYAMQEKYGQNALNEENWDWVRGRGGVASWKNKRYTDAMRELGMTPLNEEQIGQFQQSYRDLEDAMHDPQFEQNFGKYFKTNPTGKSDQMYKGKPISGKDAIWGNTTNREFLQLSGYEDPQTPPETIPGTTPITPPPMTPPEEWEEVQGASFKVPPVAMSAAETAAIGGVLGQGIQRPRESYLKLDRYKYASQLPKTLQEIQLAEQAGKDIARNIVAGDAGRYLSQSGNLSSSRMKAANDAVIQDTLARQDILNKNVDLSNTELSTNRSLKDYYDDIKRQNVNDYNALLVKGGQSVDENFDNYQRMRNENIIATQGLQLMADMNPNYTLVQNPDGTYRTVSRYKKKSTTPAPTPASTPTPTPTSTPPSSPQQSSSTSSLNMFAPFNKMAQAGILPPQKSPNLNTSFQQMMQNSPQSGIPTFNATVLGQNSKLPRFGLSVPTIKEKGTKKAKTYKRK